MVTDFSDFEQDTLDLISKAHGATMKSSLLLVDSCALLSALCASPTFDVKARLGTVGVDGTRFCRTCESLLPGGGFVRRGGTPELADELGRIFAFAQKIAARCQRRVQTVDLFCALGSIPCKAKPIFEKFGISLQKLDELFEVERTAHGASDSEASAVDYLRQLDALIGLSSVKEDIRKLADMVKFNAARRKNGLSATQLTDNFIFTGNPGTGKTTVARIIAGIYRQFDVLKKGHLVEVDRSRLVAGYVGQSALQTDAVITSALDGILFIDEAYSLAQGGTSDYGAEVASVLVKRMEDNRDRLVVIAAGYADEMQKFIGMNPGFSSRFTKYIDFPDYTGDELMQIFKSMAQTEDYDCSQEALEIVRLKMHDVASWGGRVSGNARNVRNLLKAVKERMAARVLAGGSVTREKLRRIEREDV